MANWPPDLLHLWHRFTVSGELDPHHPPATVLDAYDQVTAIQARHLREVVQDIQQDVTAVIAESEDALVPVNLRRTLAVCARGGAEGPRTLLYRQAKGHDALPHVFPGAG